MELFNFLVEKVFAVIISMRSVSGIEEQITTKTAFPAAYTVSQDVWLS